MDYAPPSPWSLPEGGRPRALKSIKKHQPSYSGINRTRRCSNPITSCTYNHLSSLHLRSQSYNYTPCVHSSQECQRTSIYLCSTFLSSATPLSSLSRVRGRDPGLYSGSPDIGLPSAAHGGSFAPTVHSNVNRNPGGASPKSGPHAHTPRLVMGGHVLVVCPILHFLQH